MRTKNPTRYKVEFHENKKKGRISGSSMPHFQAFHKALKIYICHEFYYQILNCPCLSNQQCPSTDVSSGSKQH